MSDSKASSEAPSEAATDQLEQIEQPQNTSNANDSIITNIPVLHTAKRLKIEARKLDGMQRELYSLMGENAAPVVITPESKFKTRPDWQQRAASWKLADFSPKDGLHLQHWVRAASVIDGTSGDRFARFNRETDVPQWSDSQYHLFERESWTLEETRYLFQLAKDYDLRWIVIADRYNYKRPKTEDVEMPDIDEDEAQESSKDKETDEKEDKLKSAKKQDDADKDKDKSKDNDNDKNKNKDDKDKGNDKDKEKDKQTEEKEKEKEKSTSNENTSINSKEERKGPERGNVNKSKPTEGGRTIDDLKDRYYEVYRTLIKNKPISAELGLSPHDEELLKAMNFDRANEMKRKQHLERLLLRNPKEIAEEEALILEARRLEGLADKLQTERQDLLRLLDSPTNLTNTNALKLELSTSHGVGQLLQDLNNDKAKRTLLGANGPAKDTATKLAEREANGDANGIHTSAARRAVAKIVSATLNHRLTTREEAMLGISYTENIKAKAPGVYLRSSKLTPVRQSLLPKMRAVTSELGLALRPVMPTQQVCAKYESLYQSITLLLEAKKVQDKLEMEVDVLQKARSAPEKPEEETA